MIKVALCGIKGTSPDETRRIFSKQTPRGVYEWGQLKAVTEFEDPDYYICFQHDTVHTQNIPKEKKIYLQQEPDAVIPMEIFLSAKPHYMRTHEDGLNFSLWWVKATYDELVAMSYPEKTKNLHVILSYKRDTVGHKRRTDLVLDYLDKYPDNLDIYGTFCNIYKGLRWVRVHPVPEKLFSIYNRLVGNKKPLTFDKLTVSKPYKYQLVMENAREKNWVTEKLLDAYLSWNMPIYWGCPNIADYFPKDSYYEIDITDPTAIHQVRDFSQRPLTDTNIAAIAEARELILNKYNIWPALEHYLVDKGFHSI